MAGYGAGVGLQILTIFLYPLASSGTAQPDAVPAAEADGASAGTADASADGAAGDDSAAAVAAAAETSTATFELYADCRGVALASSPP